MTGRGWTRLVTNTCGYFLTPPAFRNLLHISSVRYLSSLASSLQPLTKYVYETHEGKASVSSKDLILAHPVTDSTDRSIRITVTECHRILTDCCRVRGVIKTASVIHTSILKLGALGDIYICNRLLTLYIRLHEISYARKLFDELHNRDVVTWTMMMTAYMKGRRGEGGNVKSMSEIEEEEVLGIFHGMLDSGFVPNEFTLSTVLRCCSSSSDYLELGKRVHSWIVMLGLSTSPVLGSALIKFYSSFEMLDQVFSVFCTMDFRDVVLWTTMIYALVDSKNWNGAWKVYVDMIASGTRPTDFTLSTILAACGSLGIHHGNLIHAHIILLGVNLNLVLKTALVDMYTRFHQTTDALRALSETKDSDVMLWTAMISGFNKVSDFKSAILMFQKMGTTGIAPNAFTYAGIISTSCGIPSPELGQQIHSQVAKVGLDHDASVGNALMDMYTKCFFDNDIPLVLFRAISRPNVISWTALITAFAGHHREDAFLAFTKMREDGLQPNGFTISSVLKSCLTVEALTDLRKLHGYILKTKFGLLTAKTVGNPLLDAYCRVGEVFDARKVFDEISSRDAVTYTSLVKRMNQIGDHYKALNLFDKMREDNIDIDGFILPCFLSASAGLGSLEAGRQLQCYSMKSGLDSRISVLNGVVDMYGKCGSSDEARTVFTVIKEPNVVSWNGLISCLGSNGYFSDALSAFEDMKMVGISPDSITLLVVLYTCSHAGLVDLGLEYFNSMRETYFISPQLDHYVCLIDLLGRAGRLEEAARTIDTMPFRPNSLIYKTILSSCKVHRNLPLGESMARNAMTLDPTDPAIYILLSNMYDDAGKLEYAKQIRGMMKERGIVKCPGESWIEIRSKVYLFRAGDTSNPWIDSILKELESLEAKIEGRPLQPLSTTTTTLMGVPRHHHHSEKLALGFGLLKTVSDSPIRIIKNLRTCEDCHDFMVVCSKIVGREIVMRDGNRFHIFKNGMCSCGGYW
ncbi:Pentatricopeptide repeat-containing protein [Zostera marina]|uniref:Pentatricopeptide repeat-containing protein n=1 Tax=Zostera marina TaxID=29655 RepID=A0A0K9NX31_ZOSMR|nr:Pentatricopeptide repeat-containing protein [Zostera marina]